MTILEVTAVPFTPAHRGGGESYPWWLTHELSKREQVIACYSSESAVDPAGIRTCRIPARFLNLSPFLSFHNPIPTWGGVRAIRRLLVSLRGEIEFVHVHNLRTASSTAWLALARACRDAGGFKVLLTDHGARWFPLPRLSAETADYYVPVSETSRSYLMGLAPRPSYLVPNGVRSDHPGLLRPPRAFDDREYDLTFFGRIAPWKRPDLMLRLAHDLATDGSRTPRVLIAGSEAEPGYLQELMRTADRLGLRPTLTVVANPSDDEAAELLSRSKLLVLFSSQRDASGRYHPAPELAGTTTLEAAACGTPSIVNDLPWAHEQIVPGRTGLIVRVDDWKDTVADARSLLGDRARWERLSSRTRAHVAAERTFSALANRLSGFLQAIRDGRV